jgi:CheY-like chemotaxis protein
LLQDVEMVARDRFDLVFMDMQMPELDGLDATRVIRAADSGHKVPILAMTANAFVEDKVLCREAGMNDFITKPVDPVVLYEVMLRIFQSHTA